MKAARLNELGQPMVIEEIAEPVLRPGGIRVKVLSASVPSFTGAVMSGQMPMPLPVPFTPGPSCVGEVEAVADDVIGFEVGQRVFCAPNLTVRTNGGGVEKILIGWFALTPGAGQLMEQWKDGCFAEKAVYPASCVTPLGAGDPNEQIALGPLAISYGGLLGGNLQPGQGVLINGATGNLGAAAVLAALAMGAATVFAVGRNQEVLDQVKALDPARVQTVALQGEPEAYAKQVAEAALGVDMVLDALGYVAGPEPTLAAMGALRPGGTMIFMGGVMADIPVPYLTMVGMELTVRGSFMYPAWAPAALWRMVACGTLDLGKTQSKAFALDDINEAVAAAGAMKCLSYCVVTP